MSRMLGIVLAGGLLALGGQDRAMADATAPPAPPSPPAVHTVTARAHLLFRSDPDETPIEGRVVVIQHPAGLTVVESLQSTPDPETRDRVEALALLHDPDRDRE